MAINMDKMKQKLESLQGNGNKKSAFGVLKTVNRLFVSSPQPMATRLRNIGFITTLETTLGF